MSIAPIITSFEKILPQIKTDSISFLISNEIFFGAADLGFPVGCRGGDREAPILVGAGGGAGGDGE